MREAAGELADRLHLLRLAHPLLAGPALGQVAGDLGEADEAAAVVADGGDDDVGPEARAVLAQPPALQLVFADIGGLGEGACRNAGGAVGLGIEAREMLADDLLALIALDALRAGIPAHDIAARIDHEDCVVGHRVDQQGQMLLGRLEPCRAHRRTRFERRIDALQFGFGLGTRRELALARLIEPCVVDGDRGLRGDAHQQPLGERRELVGLRMAEEQPAEHLARARHDRHGKVGTDG